jgi:hypothetical protein
MNDSSTLTYAGEAMSFAPFPNRTPDWSQDDPAHPGYVLNGLDDTPGQKAYYIHMEAKPDKEEKLQAFLQDINTGVDKEPLTGPWFGLRYSKMTFCIFEAFPNAEARHTHDNGPGGRNFLRSELLLAGLPGAALPARHPSWQVRRHAGPAGQARLIRMQPGQREGLFLIWAPTLPVRLNEDHRRCMGPQRRRRVTDQHLRTTSKMTAQEVITRAFDGNPPGHEK